MDVSSCTVPVFEEGNWEYATLFSDPELARLAVGSLVYELWKDLEDASFGNAPYKLGVCPVRAVCCRLVYAVEKLRTRVHVCMPASALVFLIRLAPARAHHCLGAYTLVTDIAMKMMRGIYTNLASSRTSRRRT